MLVGCVCMWSIHIHILDSRLAHSRAWQAVAWHVPFWIGLKAFTLVQCFLRKITVSPLDLKRQQVPDQLEKVTTLCLLVLLL